MATKHIPSWYDDEVSALYELALTLKAGTNAT